MRYRACFCIAATVKLSDPAAEPRIAPTLGRHTDKVLRGLLNFGGEELAELPQINLFK